LREAGLLDPEFLGRLERLTLRARRLYLGREAGEKKTPRRGAGLEFAGHRGYVPGDDLRHLDWALLGRLGRAFLKVYEQEEDLTLHLVLDTSSSMGFGDPTKLHAGCRIAAALGHIALSSLDRVGAALFDGRGLSVHPPARGKGILLALLRFLEGAAAEGPRGAAEALKLHAASSRAGLTVILSDFMERGILEALRPHRFRRHSLVLVQLLSPEELDPTLDGDLRLVDSETGEGVEVSVGPKERAAYRSRLDAHREELREFGSRYGVDVFSIRSDLPLEQVVWDHLLRGSFIA
jgi:uncharacterized protein (DUF58 family)